jgi:hypothetical protein
MKPTPLLELGRVVATPGALEHTNPFQRGIYLARHQCGDWGCICDEDRALNDQAVV